MSIFEIEDLMYRVSDIFLAPVLIALLVLFVYCLFAFGQFFAQGIQRRRNQKQYQNLKESKNQISGYSLFNFYQENRSRDRGLSMDDLEVFALTRLETVRLITRISPMLGLIATMVPMGPALKSLADGNIQGISDNLVIAFSAVIFGLVISTITFWIAAVKKRWLATELVDLQVLINIDEQKASLVKSPDIAQPVQAVS